MASDRIEGLRTTQFPTERRGGYDREAIDSYLAEFADWLESDDAKRAIAKREIEQVGERTGAIITAAQDGADKITSEAQAEADARLADAERETSEQRAATEAYVAETRTAADEGARSTREAAESEAAQARSEADEHARLTIREADERLERAAREAEERTAGVENEIADLAAKRDLLVANLESMVAGIRTAIDGPGSEDLGLPERSRTTAAFVGDADPAGVPEQEPETVPESEEEPQTQVEPVEPVEIVAEEIVAEVEPESDPGFEDTRPYMPELDTDEELYEDGRPPDPLPSGRDPERNRSPSEGRDDPRTDKQKLSELP